MRIRDMSDAEVTEALWPLARSMGHSRDRLDGMLKRGTPRQVLTRLQRDKNRRQVRNEREDREAWSREEAERRREVFDQRAAMKAAALRREREEQTLPERVANVLTRALMQSEGTRGTAYEAQITTGERTPPMPSLPERPLIDQTAEILDAVLTRVEREVDEATTALPVRSKEQRDREVLDTTGHASLVALRFGCSESLVRKLRTLAGLRPVDGELDTERQEKSKVAA